MSSTKLESDIQYAKELLTACQLIKGTLFHLFLQSPSQMMKEAHFSLNSASSKKREGRLWSTDSSLFPLISKSVKISSFVSTNLGNMSFFLIIVFKKCVWGLNWHFGNVWSFTSHFAYWSVNCNYHNILQETVIFLQKEPIFAVYTVALFPY